MSNAKPSKVIDVDSHIGMPPDVWDYLPDKIKKRDERLRNVEEDGSLIYLTGRCRFPQDRLVLSADFPHLDFELGQMPEYLERDDLTTGLVQKTLCDDALDFFRWENAAASIKQAEE